VAAVAAVGLMMTGCAIKLPLLASKPAAMPTRPSCPAMTSETWRPVVDEAVHKTFDRQLQKRFGDTNVHMRIGWSKDDKGNTVITAMRIGSASYAMPEPGHGGEVEVVFQPCTGKHLQTRKLANLEKTPKLVSDGGAATPKERPAPRKRGFKWPWKS
jgi:hypothetical protein